ncbi:hypothetical protein FHX34_103601 [Actinoplanes teichomyceticus]|uniref:Uncharacterized protein n=2 Tax=Actinoplanes teichomyceticus TaxID=1867 RepID=A0A561WB39_ACTTI|nr:hypothetical protein FHX34_103601 [Actinoplanes teichomyceticus]
MPEGTHNNNCAYAKGHDCACGGCGGARHGWQGWLRMAGDADRRSARSRHLRARLTRRQNGGLRRDQPNRARIVDLARLDTADWLARQHDAPAGSRERPDLPSELDQVAGLGRALADDTWSDIRAAIDATAADPARARRQLAAHTWCDLLVALIRSVEVMAAAEETFGDSAADAVVRAILASSRQKDRDQITEQILRIVVSRVFAAIRVATIAHVPVLQLLTDPGSLPALRALAVFICPAPERHPEVRRYALAPLAANGPGAVTAQTRHWLSEVWPDWPAPGPS